MLPRLPSATELDLLGTTAINRSSPEPKRGEKRSLSKDEKAAKKAKKAKKQEAAAKAQQNIAEQLEHTPAAESLKEHRDCQATDVIVQRQDRLKQEIAAAAEADDARAFMKANEITIHDPSAPLPCIALASAPFPQPLVDLLLKQGFSAPSAVQGASWPLAMAGRDVLAVAKTGSGKTLGYLLPALARCHAGWEKAGGHPLCLVMSPTRELALQIQGEAVKFGAPLGCRAVAVYGGAPKWPQASALSRGCEIVIATPGRMMDMLDLHSSSNSPAKGGGGKGGGKGGKGGGKGGGGNAATSLERCQMLVLDEADRMLDMGFEKDIRAIVAGMPPDRQTFLFTATWPKAVQRVAADLLGASQCKVTVGSGGEKLTANKAVTQNVKVVTASDKWATFVELLAPYKPGGAMAGTRAIIFANTKKDVNGIGQYLWDESFPVDTLSGDRSQREREDVIRHFRSGAVTIVVATDVAARGLDINGIERVINYDYPPGDGGSEDYIHRIGRTGRAGASGVADTLFTQADAKHAKEIVRILADAGQSVSSELLAMASKGGGGGGRSGSWGRKGKGGGKGGGKGNYGGKWW